MADISKITLPNGTTYNVKDTNARDRIEVLENTSTNVTVTPITTTGTNIADIVVDGTTYQLFAPSSGGGGSSLELLWTNPSPTSSFAPQTISIDLSRYKGIVVDFFIAGDDPTYVSTICMLNETTKADTAFHTSNALQIRYRNVTPSSTGVEFSTGYAVTQFNGATTELNYTMIPYHIYGIGSGGKATETAFVYSNEERVVGVWTDNRPLYQKTFSIQSNSQSRGMIEIPITDISTNIDDIIKFIGCTSNANYNRPVPLAYRYYEYSTITETLNLLYNKSSSKFVVYWRDIDFGTAYITVQYTKTTDTPGSGPYVTSGSYAHHYSTTEQVVGTWIDGSTLYEKTQHGGITFSTLRAWYDTNFTNIDKVISVQGSILRDGEPIGIGYWTSTIVSSWILRDHTLKMAMQEGASGETYALDSITVRYTKTS